MSISTLPAAREQGDEGPGEQHMEADAPEASGEPQDLAEASRALGDLDADQEPEVCFVH